MHKQVAHQSTVGGSTNLFRLRIRKFQKKSWVQKWQGSNFGFLPIFPPPKKRNPEKSLGVIRASKMMTLLYIQFHTLGPAAHIRVHIALAPALDLTTS